MTAARQGAGSSPAPLVINTPGWVKGLGLSILQDLITQLQPTHVLAIDGLSHHKNLPAGRFWADGGVVDAARAPVRTSLPCLAQQPDARSASPDSRTPSRGSVSGRASVGSELTALHDPMHKSAAAARSRRFHAWVCSVLSARLPAPLSDDDVLLRLFEGSLGASMAQLCSCAPVAVDLQHVAVVSLFQELDDAERAAALNGSLVCLSSCASNAPLATAPSEVRLRLFFGSHR